MAAASDNILLAESKKKKRRNQYQQQSIDDNNLDKEIILLVLGHDYILREFLGEGNEEQANIFRLYFRQRQQLLLQNQGFSPSTSLPFVPPLDDDNHNEGFMLTITQQERLLAFRRYYKLHRHQYNQQPIESSSSSSSSLWLHPSTVRDFNAFYTLLRDKKKRSSIPIRIKKKNSKTRTSSSLLQPSSSSLSSPILPPIFVTSSSGSSSPSASYFYFRRHRRKKCIVCLVWIIGIVAGIMIAFELRVQHQQHDTDSTAYIVLWTILPAFAGVVGGLFISCLGMPIILSIVDCCEEDGCKECFDYSCFLR